MVEAMELAVAQIAGPYRDQMGPIDLGAPRAVDVGCRFANGLLTAASRARRQAAEIGGKLSTRMQAIAASCSRGSPHAGGKG